eukprot:NODE_2148_length_1267_cov_56.478947_g2042_i0.p1 GENE.NODE_2148_length_1267_cov_56.478947_g2042_i0~~NODE_2148_length_1267_cov_56.478947_g2042_i0.p1  ORF type:complete len:361 (-),score=53.35 NODE_2148_length_1267_cov_56.478947_g2042_i0:111-1193(-)
MESDPIQISDLPAGPCLSPYSRSDAIGVVRQWLQRRSLAARRLAYLRPHRQARRLQRQWRRYYTHRQTVLGDLSKLWDDKQQLSLLCRKGTLVFPHKDPSLTQSRKQYLWQLFPHRVVAPPAKVAILRERYRELRTDFHNEFLSWSANTRNRPGVPAPRMKRDPVTMLSVDSTTRSKWIRIADRHEHAHQMPAVPVHQSRPASAPLSVRTQDLPSWLQEGTPARSRTNLRNSDDWRRVSGSGMDSPLNKSCPTSTKRKPSILPLGQWAHAPPEPPPNFSITPKTSGTKTPLGKIPSLGSINMDTPTRHGTRLGLPTSIKQPTALNDCARPDSSLSTVADMMEVGAQEGELSTLADLMDGL